MTTLRLAAAELADASVVEPLHDGIEQNVESAGTETLAAPVEYRVLYVAKAISGLPNDGVEDDLNKAAREGWRMVGAVTNDEGRTTGLIVERAQAAT